MPQAGLAWRRTRQTTGCRASRGFLWTNPAKPGWCVFNSSPHGFKAKLPIIEALQGQAFKMNVS